MKLKFKIFILIMYMHVLNFVPNYITLKIERKILYYFNYIYIFTFYLTLIIFIYIYFDFKNDFFVTMNLSIGNIK